MRDVIYIISDTYQCIRGGFRLGPCTVWRAEPVDAPDWAEMCTGRDSGAPSTTGSLQILILLVALMKKICSLFGLVSYCVYKVPLDPLIVQQHHIAFMDKIP